MSDEQNQEAVKAGAVKYDAGKSPVFKGGLAYFPKAISLVSDISNFGSRKYAWAGWRNVPDGFTRYSDAMLRHLVAEAEGEIYDPDSGLLTIGHTCWNALARTELAIIDHELLKSS